MNHSQLIVQAMREVRELRDIASQDPGLSASLRAIKAFQSRRFELTYQDFLDDVRFKEATWFFLNELYGVHDFSERDAQFVRIASPLTSIFPSQVGEVAIALADLHLLTESLDMSMAKHWLRSASQFHPNAEIAHYIFCWRKVDRNEDRFRQLNDLASLGRALAALTQLRGLGSMLRLMRAPANHAGMGALQKFLEKGFETFRTLTKSGLAPSFLGRVVERETTFLSEMCNSEAGVAHRALHSLFDP